MPVQSSVSPDHSTTAGSVTTFMVELRAWGDAPNYTMARTDPHDSPTQPLYRHDTLVEVIGRERHVRPDEDGIHDLK